MTIVRCRQAVLFDLPEDPRIAGSHPAYHDAIASGLCDHGASIFGRADVSVPDHRDLYRIFDGSDPFPTRSSAVTLFAGTSVESYRGKAALFGHASEFDADNFFFIPSSAEFDGERNLHRGADRFEDLPDRREITQKS